MGGGLCDVQSRNVNSYAAVWREFIFVAGLTAGREANIAESPVLDDPKFFERDDELTYTVKAGNPELQ